MENSRNFLKQGKDKFRIWIPVSKSFTYQYVKKVQQWHQTKMILIHLHNNSMVTGTYVRKATAKATQIPIVPPSPPPPPPSNRQKIFISSASTFVIQQVRSFSLIHQSRKMLKIH